MRWCFVLSAVLSFSLSASATSTTSTTVERASERALLDRFAKTNMQGFASDLESLSQRDPEFYQDMLNEQAVRNPEAYEIYREFKASTAPDVETFMTWATDEEIADDTVDEKGQSFNWDILSLFQPTSLAPPEIEITIHLPKYSKSGRVSQVATMDATGGGLSIEGMQVATGRPGHLTPRGCRRVFNSVKHYFSRKYKAPMPYATFFRPGIALHGGKVGVASHGCVHLPLAVAAKVFYAVLRVGWDNAEVCVQ